MMHAHGNNRETDLAMLDHLMACGEMVAAQTPSPTNWTPEKRLAAAILASALTGVRDHAGERKYRRKLAEDLDWIRSDESEWPFSFLRLCDIFGLDAGWVRGVVQSWVADPGVHSRRTFSTFRQAA